MRPKTLVSLARGEVEKDELCQQRNMAAVSDEISCIKERYAR